MQSLRAVLDHAKATRTAIGHFNVSDLVLLKAVFEAARGLNVPVIVGASEGERDFMGPQQIAALVRSLREDNDFPVFLNADHTHSLAKAAEAARAGFDMVVFDRSMLPFEQNVRETRQAVEVLKGIHPSVIVEGEIGDIGSGSEVHEQAPDLTQGLTTPEEARQFVDGTSVDVLAPAVGNMHGMLRAMVSGAAKKRLDIERIGKISRAAGTFLTLHGGSGTEDADFRASIRAGITVVHVNTELRLAWRRGLEQSLRAMPDEVAPYKILPEAVEQVRQVVYGRLLLFTGLAATA